MDEDYYEDDDHPDFEEWQSSRSDMMENMLKNLFMFSRAVDNAAIGIGELYDEVHSEDEIEAAGLALMAMMDSLANLMAEGDAALRGLCGYDEPPPTEQVEDFEASVLTTLANLDTISDEDVERARIERYKERIYMTGW